VIEAKTIYVEPGALLHVVALDNGKYDALSEIPTETGLVRTVQGQTVYVDIDKCTVSGHGRLCD
jgi:hypothetical protein